ncbi:GntR family transcriptional regulator [Rubrivivax albus]|uniref:GntR family transcriptional regulator n=1 Tax=Rubrivivax albus TaxID=2499835 RepID=A0A437K272_9BURK|nr:GntR family transcriptional regulator [Rubrivivax albus]MCB1997488.1 GntR family transcriptional regulator [Rhodoferax sp.]RVT54401.1 GntR family transcriptional regulator [Rubrivivax albus]
MDTSSTDDDALARWERVISFRLFTDARGGTLTVPEQIAARVGERIVRGQLDPGERVGEQELADEFGVSRGPVREAIRLLEREGLLTVLARRGAIVSAPSATELRELFEVRAGLHEMAVRRIGHHWPPELLAVMRAGVRRLQSLVDAPDDGTAYAEMVHRLTQITGSFAGNERLRRLIVSHSLQTLRYSRLGLATPERRRQSIRLWTLALAAMERGDTEQVVALVHQRTRESAQEASTRLAPT